MGDTKCLCKVCQRNWSKYTCPRCNMHYCSLDCYQQHGQQCTETFHRENVVQQMQQHYTAGDERYRMLDILKRLHEADAAELAEIEAREVESEDDTEDTTQLELSNELMQKLSVMGDEQDIDVQESDLAPEDLQAFKRAAATGQLASLVQPWVPWWSLPEAAEVQLAPSGESKVILQGKSGSISKSGSEGLPAAPEHALPKVISLTKATPSPLLQWQLLDVLYSYAFVMRLYNGDCRSDAQEAVSILLLVSAVLSSAATSKPQQKSKSGAAVEPNDKAASAQMHVMTTSASEAMSGCMERVCRPAMAGHVGSTTAVALLHDLAVFMQLGRSATVLALNDVQRLFDASIVDLPAVANDRIAKDTDVVDQAKHQHVQKHLKRVRAQYLMVQHKVGFMLAWANELSDLTYNGLHDAVLNEMHEHEVPQAKEPNSLFNLQPESYVGSILQSDKLSLQQKPKIQTL